MDLRYENEFGRLGYWDSQDFVKRFNPGNRHRRKESERFRKSGYKEIEARDKTRVDMLWVKGIPGRP